MAPTSLIIQFENGATKLASAEALAASSPRQDCGAQAGVPSSPAPSSSVRLACGVGLPAEPPGHQTPRWRRVMSERAISGARHRPRSAMRRSSRQGRYRPGIPPGGGVLVPRRTVGYQASGARWTPCPRPKRWPGGVP